MRAERERRARWDARHVVSRHVLSRHVTAKLRASSSPASLLCPSSPPPPHAPARLEWRKRLRVVRPGERPARRLPRPRPSAPAAPAPAGGGGGESAWSRRVRGEEGELFGEWQTDPLEARLPA